MNWLGLTLAAMVALWIGAYAWHIYKKNKAAEVEDLLANMSRQQRRRLEREEAKK